MLRFILSKLFQGLLVLIGVVTVVFFLFNLAPGDPARNLVGENASEEVVTAMRRKLDLDLPIGERYMLYVNDLSPLSVHAQSDSSSRTFFDEKIYSGFQLLSFGSRGLYLKAPYLKRSFLTDKSVSSILVEVMPGTAVLATVSILLAMLLGMVMGILAALEKDSLFDRSMLVISALGMAGPSFFVAIIVAWIGAIVWREEVQVSWWMFAVLLAAIAVWFLRIRNKGRASLLIFLGGVTSYFVVMMLCTSDHVLRSGFTLPGTGLNMTGSLYSVDVWKGEYLDLRTMILPVITLMIRPLSVIVQLMRSSLLDVMQQDYIRTARAKGLSETAIIVKHALRNALNPVITAVSGWFASLLAGSIFVEFVFGWKGLGQQMFTAIENQDLPVVMGGVIVIACVFVLINTLVDLLYGWIDPRVR